MSYRLTTIADEDIARILRETLDLFGPLQVRTYAALIERGLVLAGRDPFAPGSSARDELGPGVRTIHLQVAARRRGASSHIVYFTSPADQKAAPVVILRVLHDRMDPARHVILSLLPDDGDDR